MELQVSTKMSFTAEKDFILPPKAVDLICNMGPGQIDIEADKGSVSVGNGSIHTKLQSFELEQFVRIDEPENNTRQFTIAADKLMQAISRVIYAVARNSNKPALNGILFDCDGSIMTIAACDGYRIAKVSIPYAATFHFILPEPAAKCLISFCYWALCPSDIISINRFGLFVNCFIIYFLLFFSFFG